MSKFKLDIFETLSLDSNCKIYTSNCLSNLQCSIVEFNLIWNLHPPDYHIIRIMGKEIKTPRWQQSFGMSYNYSGSTNLAIPVPKELNKYLEWCKTNIDDRLNGFLLNWYDGKKGHYIGAHKDATTDLVPNSPIVTISLGEERIFRFRPLGGKGYKDIIVRNGDVVIIPWETNQNWTHEIPNLKKYSQKRISITLRAYLNQHND